MARIAPVPEITGRTEPLPTPYAQPFATPQGQGAGFGDVLEQSAAVGEQFRQEHQRQTAARVMKEVAGFGEQADLLLHEPEVGALNLEGDKALGAYDGTLKKLRELQTKTAQGLTDGNQRSLFMEHSEGVVRTAQRQLEIHTSQQGAKLKTDGMVSLQKSKLDSSVKAIDQTSADAYTNEGAAATRAYWSSHANDQIAEEKVREYVATSNAARLDRLLANPATQGDAIRFFQSRHDALPADKLDTYEAKVAAVGVDQQAYDVAKRIASESIAKTGQMDRNVALQKLDAENVPIAVRVKAQGFLDHRNAIMNEGWRDKRDEVAGRVLLQMTDATTGELNPELANSADMVELERLDPVRAGGMRKRATVEGAKARYSSALEHFFGPAPDQWEHTAQMTPSEFQTDPVLMGLATKHRGQIIERFNAMRQSVAKQAPKESLVVEEAQKALGLSGTKIGQLPQDKQEKFADLFDAVADDMKDYALHHHGQAPDREKTREIIRGEVQVTASHWFTADELRFQAGAAERRAKRGRPATTAPAAVPVAAPAAVPAAPSTAPTAPATTATRRPQRTLNGVTKEWNGAAWVSPGSP